MYFEVANKLYVAASGTAYSQAISMEGANSVQVNFTAFSGTGTIAVEEGSDLENWSNSLGTTTPTSGTAFAGSKYDTFKCTPIAARYVRLRYTSPAGGAAVIGVGVNTASL
jgi:hypothetical protein